MTWLDIFAQRCFNSIYWLPRRLLSCSPEEDCQTQLLLTVTQQVRRLLYWCHKYITKVSNNFLISRCQVHSNNRGLRKTGEIKAHSNYVVKIKRNVLRAFYNNSLLSSQCLCKLMRHERLFSVFRISVLHALSYFHGRQALQ